MNNSHVVLEFDPALDDAKNDKSLRDNLSAIVRVGNNLMVASDETTTVERLTTEDGSTFKRHKRFQLSKFIDLPQGDDKEIDIEGLAHGDDYLWVIGSHSLSRPKPKLGLTSFESDFERMEKIERDANRYLLARIPVAERDGELKLLDSFSPPSNPSRTLTPATLPFTGKGNELMDALSDDRHLRPFFPIPSKDNGFDIEGLAVAGKRIFVGLRGPVLRGWALVIELEVRDPTGPLSLKEIGPEDRRYKKHFLQLDGLGIRDLLIDGADLLILAGPTMNLDGPSALYRWRGAMDVSDERLVPRDKLEKLFDVPHGEGANHAEGITFIPGADNKPALLIVYDTPADDRKIDEAAALGDVFELK